ncbi:hypothetical protein LIER_29736 [Lithospermum erythrorhizon]|uniref:Uncharacterized protein n=1 Tax=Lithospermum erythrorhizon TaxID=34254 RepID=A0AAV3RLY3_LITER
MLVDMGSSAEILYLSTYDKFGFPRNMLQPMHTPLTGFTGYSIYPAGMETLDFTMGSSSKKSTIRAQFIVVDIDESSYNGLIGRPILTALRAIVSLLHLKMKFPTAGGIGEICGNQKKGMMCYQTSVPPLGKVPEKSKKYGGENHPEEPENMFHMEIMLEENHKEDLICLIRKYKDIFAWGPPGINTSVALHKLHVESMYVSIKQKKRTFNDEKNQGVKTEIDFLLKADSIRELQFPEWIANVVLVKRPNETWRMCTYFSSLNKACLKDLYPLPCLARLVDGSAGHEVFDFMDTS